MNDSIDWGKIHLTDNATLVLGNRPKAGSKHLEAGRIELDREFQLALVQAGKRWLSDLASRTRVPYGDDLHLEPREYLGTTIDEISSHAPVVDNQVDREPDADSGPDLYAILSGALQSDKWLSPESLKRPFLFYAIVVERQGGGAISFVKQTSPQRMAKAGGWLTIFDNSLRELTRPVFALEPDVDIVVSDTSVAVLRPLAFERLFADLELSKSLIPEHVSAITKELPLKADTTSALERVSGRLARTRRLLRDLSSFTSEQWAVRTPERIREIIQRRHMNESDFFDENGDIRVTEEKVPTFLEVLASRYFTSDFDEEEMRADKVRKRV